MMCCNLPQSFQELSTIPDEKIELFFFFSAFFFRKKLQKLGNKCSDRNNLQRDPRSTSSMNERTTAAIAAAITPSHPTRTHGVYIQLPFSGKYSASIKQILEAQSIRTSKANVVANNYFFYVNRCATPSQKHSKLN